MCSVQNATAAKALELAIMRVGLDAEPRIGANQRIAAYFERYLSILRDDTAPVSVQKAALSAVLPSQSSRGGGDA